MAPESQEVATNAIRLGGRGEAGRALAELRRRQIAFGLCCGMPDRVIAEVCGLSVGSVGRMVYGIMQSTGMSDRFEFATQQNAAVRRLMWGDE